MPDYGYDLSCGTDLDPTLKGVSGSTLMEQVCIRRLYCRQGGLLSNPNALTLDARDFVAKGISGQQDLTSIEAQCAACLLDDERVATVVVRATFDSFTRTLTLSIQGTGALGPFSLVLAVSSLSVDQLAGS